MVFGEERKVGRQHVAGNCWEIKKKQKENTSGDNLGRTEHKERKWGWGWWETCAKRSKPEPSPQPEDYIGGSPIFFAISNAFPSIFSLYRRSMQSHTHIHTCIHACMHTYIHKYIYIYLYFYIYIHVFNTYICAYVYTQAHVYLFLRRWTMSRTWITIFCVFELRTFGVWTLKTLKCIFISNRIVWTHWSVGDMLARPGQCW